MRDTVDFTNPGQNDRSWGDDDHDVVDRDHCIKKVDGKIEGWVFKEFKMRYISRYMCRDMILS